ncbi:23S rRNA (guanosine(2251)-2'-O)-methyltransferase RlmB [Helcobacillus massiliensis]|uniref:23S rRNA (Guanosine2251-2'-O)-methyltransferase n=1 Tax=Helcobacillus massiliensis TaxID=521392 RepID=A0A839QRL9_9MICO|nr:23S rRNA (guanosine(2251)-2'-O)-methyltransferase RlmB [Helcobacillus massiliensis]MBB3022672.1 23S rRNA (guanosine2251-2'-O)-methyltransferase [Helcobacillus massiliensis]MCT1558265.1 23S rRNA (guanosine(2251)-2'-O)-methyltransferase RlmB [Helcobacillus massiliensis]MCT2035496.1 23S rRNA (guanosine(2251)-2'-O)-methyltransferase RlmB [Helcobacillus massiliensis]MCT2332009.1 23S rRNA (guanosine(2251)-2'-O)-methyltransferase RlmB [Helcobacillus massiliensis]MDK7742347.1 23S rRNA (guanosine(22
MARSAPKGSGGQRRRGLRGRGPTPKAEDRPYHKAYKGTQDTVGRAGAKTGRRRPKPKAQKDIANRPTHIAGRNSVLEAMRDEVPSLGLTLQIRMDVDDRVREIMRIAQAENIPLREASRNELDTMTDGAVHQGVVLTIPPYEYADIDELMDIAAQRFEAPLFVALDGITDPRNLGAILRSAGAFGVHGVIVPERRSAQMTASVYKVAAGAAGRVRVAQVTNLNRAIDDLKKRGVFAVGLDADGDQNPRELTFAPDPLVLVIGAEDKGISRLTREKCDAITSIPMAATTESLNASVAASIVLYEVAGHRARAGLR